MNLKIVMKVMQVFLGIIFLWYGGLKLFDGVSPAEELATRTMDILSFHTITPKIAIKILAIWEILIGIGFISGYKLNITLLLFFTQMIGTFTPLVLLPDLTFTQVPYAFTIVGQYIVKNIILILAGMSIYYFKKENGCNEKNVKLKT